MRSSFARVTHPDVFGEEGSFLTIRTMPAVIVVFEGESEFLLSLLKELGRSRILRFLYFNGLKNQRVKRPVGIDFSTSDVSVPLEHSVGRCSSLQSIWPRINVQSSVIDKKNLEQFQTLLTPPPHHHHHDIKQLLPFHLLPVSTCRSLGKQLSYFPSSGG
ncbi:hypothetical protein AVEN_42988-1 [Araneus ventricosus]|uniref:Uncharacterized protein n=1 Tax=Araneus ventricosus TaxID=182803 RepID=A0A4Y2AF72_ARAVE|nr:hypothetical protein AVEN_42988-1 [Araneus ventricosus]